jgi:hypothetical protein
MKTYNCHLQQSHVKELQIFYFRRFEIKKSNQIDQTELFILLFLYLVKITEFFISPSSSCYNVYIFCFQFSLTKGYPEIYKSVIWVNIILCMFA